MFCTCVMNVHKLFQLPIIFYVTEKALLRILIHHLHIQITQTMAMFRFFVYLRQMSLKTHIQVTSSKYAYRRSLLILKHVLQVRKSPKCDSMYKNCVYRG